MTIDTGTLAAFGTLFTVVMGTLVAAMVRWQKAQTKAVTDLLAAARQPELPQRTGPADGSGAWSAMPSLPMACSTDCRKDVLAAVERVEGKLDRFADRFQQALTKHGERIATVEARLPRRKTDEADSDRPGR